MCVAGRILDWLEVLRKLLSGFWRHADNTDIQISLLSDAERCPPRDQLLKVALQDTFAWCKQALNGDSGRSGRVSIDEYRTAVCAQLESLEADVCSPWRSIQRQQKERSSVFVCTASDDEPLLYLFVRGVQPRKQADVAIWKRPKMVPLTLGVSSRMSPAGLNRGKRGSDRKKTATSKRKQKVVTEVNSDSRGYSRRSGVLVLESFLSQLLKAILP